jgi:ABC-2 type transport system permease protein
MKPRMLSIARNEARLMRNDPWVVAILIIIPGVMLAFFNNGIVGGAQRAIPGLAALFGFFGLSAIGLAFYRDHHWMTWDRLRATGVRPVDVIVGKLVPLTIVFLAQYAVLFPLGWAVFGLQIHGSLLGVALVAVALAAVEVSLGLLLSVVCTGISQLNSLVSLSALLMAGLGGALAPVSTFPHWVQTIAPVSPVYWSLKGFQAVITENGGVGDVLRPAGILFAIAAGCVVLSFLFFDPAKRKRFFA